MITAAITKRHPDWYFLKFIATSYKKTFLIQTHDSFRLPYSKIQPAIEAFFAHKSLDR